jgi:hypothetical protein
MSDNQDDLLLVWVRGGRGESLDDVRKIKHDIGWLICLQYPCIATDNHNINCLDHNLCVLTFGSSSACNESKKNVNIFFLSLHHHQEATTPCAISFLPCVYVDVYIFVKRSIFTTYIFFISYNLII